MIFNQIAGFIGFFRMIPELFLTGIIKEAVRI